MTNMMTEIRTSHRVSTSLVGKFLTFLGIEGRTMKDYAAADRILGFMSEGRSAQRWEENGVPPHAHTLMNYIMQFGTDLAEELAVKRDAAIAEANKVYVKTKTYKTKAYKASSFKVPAMRVLDWRLKYGLTQPRLDRLFGFTSRGRSCRLWEETGAPSYVEFFMAYVDKYGIDLAERLISERGQEIPVTGRGDR